MSFSNFFGKSNPAKGSGAEGTDSTAPAAEPSPPPAPPATPAIPPQTFLRQMAQRLQESALAPPETAALNDQIVQAVRLSNAETAAHATEQVAIAPEMMITQASGLVAQSAAAYFEGASTMAQAIKGVLFKDMTEKFIQQDIKGATEDAFGVLLTDLLMGSAAAVAAAAGAIEAESASFSLEKIDQSLDKFNALMAKKAG